MGVKNFIKLVEKFAPQAIQTKQIGDYSNTIMGIDLSHLLYKSILAIRTRGYDLEHIVQGQRIIVTHIHTILLKMVGWKKYGITPVFVLDGKPPRAKEQVIEARDRAWIQRKEQYKKAITPEEKQKYYAGSSDLTAGELADVIKLLKLFRVTIVQAKGEADPVLALLSARGIVDYVVSDDADILIMGGLKLLKDFTIMPTKKITQIDLTILKQKLGMNTASLIDLAILLGSDYSPTIKGIGMNKAYELIKQYGTIDVAHTKTDLVPPEGYTKARECFETPYVKRNIHPHPIKPHVVKLRRFMKKFGYTDQQITTLIARFAD